ncbi:MAG: histidine--tRNA ligase [Spirochaetales bacterium]|nr:histidine--tRNA ligase [Spirochaetales bacterium]
MKAGITPRLLKGFRDFLPKEEIRKSEIITELERIFRLFGFVPIDTPILEYTDILLGKGGGETDKQVYRFLDHGKRDVSMRYDLTVPFARFMAMHRNELYLPFRRYHIAKVFRGENTQRGRYREFTQCDFDIVGSDSVSADFEILFLMFTSLKSIGLDHFKIHISDRNLFNMLLDKLEIKDHSVEILRIVDKIKKIGPDKVKALLSEITDAGKTDSIMEFITPRGDFYDSIKIIKKSAGLPGSSITRLEEVWKIIEALDISSNFAFDPSITRGLDYYTGIVFETYLKDIPSIGSVCSGGRYNNLTALYTKNNMPGVGSSIGLDRLLAAFNKLALEAKTLTVPQVIILNMDNSLLSYYHRLAVCLREENISVEIYPDKKKLAQQFLYAEKKNIPFALICGDEEKSQGVVAIKNLKTRKNYPAVRADIVQDRLKELLL